MDKHPNQSERKLKSYLDYIIKRIENEKSPIQNRELVEICKDYADFLRDNSNPHFYHEIAETSLNLLIKRKYARNLLAASNPAIAVKEILNPLVARLPTQTWRSYEQNIWQQFSTPPKIAYLLASLLNYQESEKVLEPSAGTGSLAVWSSGFGSETHTNEIDPRRRNLLCELGFTATSFNAEFINDFLMPDINIDCVMMNPPFSANGERTRLNSSKFGFRHVESALSRLKKGGKFGIILGNSTGLETKTGNEFWRKMSAKTSIKAIIKIAGREYYKNGTRVDINLIIGKKNRTEQQSDWNQTRSKIINVSASTVEDAFTAAEKLNLRLD